MSETLEQFMYRKHDPRWRAPKQKRETTKICRFNPSDVAGDMAAYEYSFGFDYRRITNGSQLSLQEWLDAKAGQSPYEPKKLPTLGALPKLTAKDRAEESWRVADWCKMTPEKRVRELEDARWRVKAALGHRMA